MRVAIIAVAALALAATATGPSFAVTPGFKDSICPEGTQYVLAVAKVHTDDPPQRVYEAAHAAAEAYARCSSQKLAYGFREAQHYADVRQAGFGIAAARALMWMGRLDEARDELLRYRAMAKEVAEWITEPTAQNSAHANGYAVASPSDNRPSMYRASAKEIVQTADELLAEIARHVTEVPRRQGAEPSPSPRP
jgi:hypothetical protein